MKTFISAFLALTLLDTAGASAQSWRGNGSDHYGQSSSYQGGGYQSRGYQDRGHGDYHRDGRGNVDTQIGLGLGLFALAAILSSQSQQDRAPVYNSGYNSDYNGGYYGR